MNITMKFFTLFFSFLLCFLVLDCKSDEGTPIGLESPGTTPEPEPDEQPKPEPDEEPEPNCIADPMGSTFTLQSMASDDGFDRNDIIPSEFTGNGDNNFPKLTWQNPPVGTQSYVLILGDKNVSNFQHLYIHSIPRCTTKIEKTLAENLNNLPGTTEGTGYFGPAAPFDCHIYEFTLYAMSIAGEPATPPTQFVEDDNLGDPVANNFYDLEGPSGNNQILERAKLCGRYIPDGGMDNCSCN